MQGSYPQWRGTDPYCERWGIAAEKPSEAFALLTTGPL